MLIKSGKQILKRSFPKLHKRWIDYVQFPHKGEITRILNGPKKQYFDSDKFFNDLQQTYPAQEKYGFDFHHFWLRGTERANFLVEKHPFIQSRGRRILEAGCGDGVTGYMLSTFPHQVDLMDMDDWRDSRVKDLNFIRCLLTEDVPVADDVYDFIFSYNTFEHLFNPQKALQELLRICKTGGYIYLEFAPLYYSPWGLHAHHALNMPFPHYFFTENFYLKKIREIGNFDIGRSMDTLQPVNKWKLSQYDQLFQDSGAEIIHYEKRRHFTTLKFIQRFPEAFGGMNLTYDDVTVHMIRILLRKGREK